MSPSFSSAERVPFSLFSPESNGFPDPVRADGSLSGYPITFRGLGRGGPRRAMWVDATVAGGLLENPKQSQVAGKMGYAAAPIEVTPNGSHWLWSWAFAIPAKAKNPGDAQKFAEWATSKDYIKLVANDEGWPSVPPGTRKSTYDKLHNGAEVRAMSKSVRISRTKKCTGCGTCRFSRHIGPPQNRKPD